MGWDKKKTLGLVAEEEWRKKKKEGTAAVSRQGTVLANHPFFSGRAVLAERGEKKKKNYLGKIFRLGERLLAGGRPTMLTGFRTSPKISGERPYRGVLPRIRAQRQRGKAPTYRWQGGGFHPEMALHYLCEKSQNRWSISRKGAWKATEGEVTFKGGKGTPPHFDSR